MGGWTFVEPRLRADGRARPVRRPRRQRQPGDRLAAGPRPRADGAGRGGHRRRGARTWSRPHPVRSLRRGLPPSKECADHGRRPDHRPRRRRVDHRGHPGALAQARRRAVQGRRAALRAGDRQGDATSSRRRPAASCKISVAEGKTVAIGADGRLDRPRRPGLGRAGTRHRAGRCSQLRPATTPAARNRRPRPPRRHRTALAGIAPRRGRPPHGGPRDRPPCDVRSPRSGWSPASQAERSSAHQEDVLRHLDKPQPRRHTTPPPDPPNGHRPLAGWPRAPRNTPAHDRHPPAHRRAALGGSKSRPPS